MPRSTCPSAPGLPTAASAWTAASRSVGIGVSQGLTQAGHGGLELEPSAQGDHGRQRLGFSLPQETQHLGRTGLREPLRRRFQQGAHLGRRQTGQPDQHRLECGRPQLAHQLAQVLLARRRRRFVDRLENLGQDARFAEPSHEGVEPFPLIRLERLVPPDDEPGLLQHRCDGLEVGGAEDVGKVCLERGEHVSPGPVFLPLLEDVEQDRHDVGAQVLLVLLGDGVVDPADLRFVEPVQRGVEFLEVYDGALGRRFLGDLALGLLR